MADHHVVARRESVTEPGDDGPRVVLVRYEVRDRHQKHRRRLVEVRQRRHVVVVEDVVGPPQVGLEDANPVVVSTQVQGQLDRDRIDVDVEHTRVGCRLLRYVAGISDGWGTRSQIEELPDADVDAEADGPVEEVPFSARIPFDSRHRRSELSRQAPANREVACGQQRIVNSGQVRMVEFDSGAWPRQAAHALLRR